MKKLITNHKAGTALLALIVLGIAGVALSEENSAVPGPTVPDVQTQPASALETLAPILPSAEPEVPEEGCHPSYSGCLRADASDYDCAGGSGNGPYYAGSVRVTGPDVFDLDRDGDGLGCE